MWATVRAFFRKVVGAAAAPDPQTGESFLEQLAGVARPFVEALTGLDLNGDNAVDTRATALANAEAYGIGKLRKLLDVTVDADELRRLYAIGLAIPAAAGVLKRFGVELKWKWLEGAVWGAYIKETEK